MQATDRLTAVDLRDLSEPEHAALRQEAIRLGIPLSEYFSRLISDKSTELVEHQRGGPTGGGRPTQPNQ